MTAVKVEGNVTYIAQFNESVRMYKAVFELMGGNVDGNAENITVSAE